MRFMLSFLQKKRKKICKSFCRFARVQWTRSMPHFCDSFISTFFWFMIVCAAIVNFSLFDCSFLLYFDSQRCSWVFIRHFFIFFVASMRKRFTNCEAVKWYFRIFHLFWFSAVYFIVSWSPPTEPKLRRKIQFRRRQQWRTEKRRKSCTKNDGVHRLFIKRNVMLQEHNQQSERTQQEWKSSSSLLVCRCHWLRPRYEAKWCACERMHGCVCRQHCRMKTTNLCADFAHRSWTLSAAAFERRWIDLTTSARFSFLCPPIDAQQSEQMSMPEY